MDPSSAIWDATKSLCSFLNNKASYAYNLEENLKLVEQKWEKLEAKKKDLEECVQTEEITADKQRSHQLTCWINSMEKLQEEIKNIQVCRHKQSQNKCLTKYCPKSYMSSYKLGKNVVKLLGYVQELEAEGEQYCKDINIFLKHLHKPNDEMPSGEMVGLDLMFDKIVKSIAEENVGIIGLYGMGGVGKTTLLKKIRNELGKQSGFHVMWVVVSKSPNLDRIMDVIRRSIGIGGDIWNSCSSQDEKATKIHKVLKVKKFVLFLDDIWDKLDLEKVGVPNLKETNFQSKVLFTTRLKDVCAKMKSQKKFRVEVLTEKEALELFRMKVGEETLKVNPIIPKIAEEMAKECKGLPLALSVIGSAMAGVESVEAWEHSKSNLTNSSWTALGLETQVFSVLKFSYDRLPNETHKKCFLYCALYPEDYEIYVHDLIAKWMGEGLLNDDEVRSVYDMRCYGGSIIDKLKLSCLLENVEHGLGYLEVKMHDVIRDMALWITRDEDRNKKKIIVDEDVGAICQANVFFFW